MSELAQCLRPLLLYSDLGLTLLRQLGWAAQLRPVRRSPIVPTASGNDWSISKIPWTNNCEFCHFLR